MSESEEAEFRERLARETGDAVYGSWAILAEILVVSGLIRKEVLMASLKRSLDDIARTHPNSLTHYVFHHAWESYSMDDDPSPGSPKRPPAWLRGVVDGGKGKES